MTTIDILTLLITLWAAIHGLRKGLIGQVTSLVAIVVACLAALLFGGVLTELVTPVTGETTAPLVSRLVLFLAVYIAVSLAGRMLRKISKALLMEPLDRLAGLVASVLKWWLAISVVINLLMMIKPDGNWAPLQQVPPVSRFITGMAPTLWGIATENIDRIPSL